MVLFLCTSSDNGMALGKRACRGAGGNNTVLLPFTCSYKSYTAISYFMPDMLHLKVGEKTSILQRIISMVQRSTLLGIYKRRFLFPLDQ